MKTGAIEILTKNKIEVSPAKSSGCCGGPAKANEDACCALDEQKKSEGESGCGCNTGEATSGSGCC